eukprot:GEMP01002547.1.p1 GENE.GEMP01002547.1~~GEMP01002547.1.p1  ORF type:complete len:1151 (+),score=186.42 GEMP01002547.1:93-3545(+)
MIATSFAVWRPNEQPDGLAELLMQYPTASEDVISSAVGVFALPNGVPRTPTSLHAFTFTGQTGKRSYGAALWIGDEGVCLTVMGNSPFWQAFASFLLAACDPAIRTSIAVNFISETPDPRHGQGVRQISLGVTVTRPPLNALPLLDLPCRVFFESLGVDNAVFVVAAVLCERHVVLVSESLSLVSACAEILMMLCWPVLPQGVYVPMVPSSLAEIAGHPVPFLLGLHIDSLQQARPMLEPHTIIANLDIGTVQEAEATTVVMDARDTNKPVEKFTGFPHGRTLTKLKQRLQSALVGDDWQKGSASKKLRYTEADTTDHCSPKSLPALEQSPRALVPTAFSSNSSAFTLLRGRTSSNKTQQAGNKIWSDQVTEYTEHCMRAGTNGNEAFRLAFVNVLVEYIGDYVQYCNPSSNHGFDHRGFIKHLGSHPFYKLLVHSQGWNVYISKRIPPHRTEADARDFLLFDEFINAKRNRAIRIRKVPTPLLDLNLQTSENYNTVPLYSPSPVDGTSSRIFPAARAIQPMGTHYIPEFFQVKGSDAKVGEDIRTTVSMQSAIYCSWLATWTMMFKGEESPELAFAKVDMAQDVLNQIARSDKGRKGIKTPLDLVMSTLLRGIAEMNCPKSVQLDAAGKLYTWMQENDRLGSKTLGVFFEEFTTKLAASRLVATKDQPKPPRRETLSEEKVRFAKDHITKSMSEHHLIQLNDQRGFRIQLRLIACTTTEKCRNAEFVEDGFVDTCSVCGVGARQIKAMLDTRGSVVARLLLPDEIYKIVLTKEGAVDDVEVFLSCLWHFRRLNLFSRHLFVAFKFDSTKTFKDTVLEVVRSVYGPPQDEELTWRRLEQIRMHAIDCEQELARQHIKANDQADQWFLEKKFIQDLNEQAMSELIEMLKNDGAEKDRLKGELQRVQEEHDILLKCAATQLAEEQKQKEELKDEIRRIREERDLQQMGAPVRLSTELEARSCISSSLCSETRAHFVSADDIEFLTAEADAFYTPRDSNAEEDQEESEEGVQIVERNVEQNKELRVVHDTIATGDNMQNIDPDAGVPENDYISTPNISQHKSDENKAILETELDQVREVLHDSCQTRKHRSQSAGCGMRKLFRARWSRSKFSHEPRRSRLCGRRVNSGRVDLKKSISDEDDVEKTPRKRTTLS